jgi:RsiW-degrading membrane proteinase PrsW (M82 family)
MSPEKFLNIKVLVYCSKPFNYNNNGTNYIIKNTQFIENEKMIPMNIYSVGQMFIIYFYNLIIYFYLKLKFLLSVVSWMYLQGLFLQLQAILNQ